MSARVVGALWAVVAIGCAAPAARPSPMTEEVRPPVAVVAAPEPTCGVPRIEPGLAPTGLREDAGDDRATPSEAERDVGDLALAIGELFGALRDGDVPERLRRSDHAPESRALLEELLARAAERGPCPTRVVSLHYPHGQRHRATVGVEVRDAEGELGVAAVEAQRGGAGSWRFSVGELAQQLDEHATLRRAIATVRRLDVPVVSDGDADFARVMIGEAGGRTFCVRVAWLEGAPPATRCFAGELGDATSAWFAADDVLCLSSRPAAAETRTWVTRWPDGPIHRGDCDGEEPRFGPEARRLRSVPPPFDVEPLAAVSIARQGGVLVFETRSLARVCLSSERAFACGPAWTQDDLGLPELSFDGAVVALGDDGAGWVALRKRRDESGAEARAGDEALVLLEIEGERLRPHGELPLGGYASERLEHDPEVRTVWETTSVGHERVDVDRSGCVTVGPQSRSHRVTVRRFPEPRVLSESTPDPRRQLPDRYDGRPLGDVYTAMDLDASGSWRPIADGGFERVPGCVPTTATVAPTEDLVERGTGR